MMPRIEVTGINPHISNWWAITKIPSVELSPTNNHNYSEQFPPLPPVSTTEAVNR